MEYLEITVLKFHSVTHSALHFGFRIYKAKYKYGYMQ